MDILSSLGGRTTFNETPTVEIWLLNLELPYTITLCMSTICAIIVFALAILHLYFIIRYVSNDRIQTDLYYIALMCPVTTICGVVGMFIPRAITFLNAVALVYSLLCLFVVVTLMQNIFGSREALAQYSRERNQKISFRVFPVCCFKCLPDANPSKTNLRRLEWMVFQTPIIRTVLEITNLVVFLELNHRRHIWFQISNLAGIISMLVAFYGCYVMVPLGKGRLTPYRFWIIFRFVDLAQGLYTVQKFVLDVAAIFNFFEDGPVIGAMSKAQYWTSFMFTWEMVVLSALATYLLRPSKTVFFDRHPHVLPRPMTTANLTQLAKADNNNNKEEPDEESDDGDPPMAIRTITIEDKKQPKKEKCPSDLTFDSL